MKVERTVVEQLLPKGERFKFYCDWRQAERVLGALIERLSQKGPPYNTAHVPQTDLPSNMEKGSKEHAIFLFAMCLWMRGGVESDTAANFLKEMYEKCPEIFDPYSFWDSGREATKRQIERVTDALTLYRLGQRVEENAPGWVYNMRKLARFWEGDPRQLMKDRPRFKKLVSRIKGKTTGENKEFINEDKPHGFMYFREKMVAMIAYFLMDAKLVPMFFAPVPVDFHVLRLLTANGIIRVRGKSIEEAVGIDFMNAATQRIAREVTEGYCREFNVSPIALCDSLWLLSRSLCRNNPGNSGYVANDRRKAAKELKKSEEEGEEDSDFWFDSDDLTKKNGELPVTNGAADLLGRKRYQGLKFTPEELSRSSTVRRFERSCGMCPLHAEGTCRYNISSGAYYVKGKLLPERLRFIPETSHVQDHFLEHADFKHSLQIDPTIRFAPIKLVLTPTSS